eukprot:5089062-Lingulodinium_polyedra.AAC.1
MPAWPQQMKSRPAHSQHRRRRAIGPAGARRLLARGVVTMRPPIPNVVDDSFAGGMDSVGIHAIGGGKQV